MVMNHEPMDSEGAQIFRHIHFFKVSAAFRKAKLRLLFLFSSHRGNFGYPTGFWSNHGQFGGPGLQFLGWSSELPIANRIELCRSSENTESTTKIFPSWLSALWPHHDVGRSGRWYPWIYRTVSIPLYWGWITIHPKSSAMNGNTSSKNGGVLPS